MAKYQIGDIEFEGRTKTEAREKAEQFAAKALTGVYDPKLLSWRNHTLVVWRTVDGWAYRILWPNDYKYGTWLNVWPNTGEQTLEEATKRGTYHLAQAAWQPEDGLTVPDFVTESSVRQELISWQRWQLRYKHFESLGNSPDTCRIMANDFRHTTPYDQDAPIEFEECQTCERAQIECECE